jgi:phosphoglycolate phosphatase
MTRFSAVIFDLDGTLLDTIDDLTDAMNAALAAMGFPTHSVERCKHFIGDGVRLYVERALPPHARDEQTILKMIDRYRREYSARWRSKTRPYEGVPELLDLLRTRNIPAAVLSNKPHDFTKVCVQRLLPQWQFAAVLGEGPDVPKKPDASGALAIARQLGLAPREVLYVGDTNTDMRTAVAAGMYPVGALWGFRTAGELLDAGAAKLIERPLDLVGLIDTEAPQ